jgi:hypothetical protein
MVRRGGAGSEADEQQLRSALRLGFVLVWLWPAARLHADAIVRTQAMLASTIAEYFVEPDRVRVELEIGLNHLEGFRNLLPDEIYAQLELPPEPFAGRLARFFEHDLAISAEDGIPLAGRLLSIEPGPRVERDDVSGEPLPASGDEEPETVLLARLEYALPGRPSVLTLHGLRTEQPADIGFVAYDRGIAVNDFRYLTPAQTLELDWSDPWYTRFRARSLRRQYFAPMSGFLYVEPYEVRKEIIARPSDLQDFVDLGLEGRDTIPVEMQDGLKRRAAEFLRSRQPVEIDGASIEPELARVNFLERTLRTSRVVDPPVELDAHAAILGLIFVYPTDGLPERVTMQWDLWNERIQQIPVAAVDQAGPFPMLLEPDFPELEWQNFLQNPELPTLVEILPPPSVLARGLRIPRWLLLCAAIVIGVQVLRGRRGGRGLTPARAAAPLLALALAGIAFWGSRDASLSQIRAREVVSGLLHNVYRAFDFRDEERIYDVLARSVEGDLLTRIYLETRRGLELASQGGARAKVKQVDVVELEAEASEGGSFVATASWNVAGSIGHWGHLHERRNRYRAELRVAPVEGAWKLVDIEVLDEERL